MDTSLVFRCADAEARRLAVSRKADLNGIDWLEVGDLIREQLPADEQAQYDATPPGPHREQLLWQRRLVVNFLNTLTADHQDALSDTGIVLSGGERIPAPRVTVLGVDPLAKNVVLRCSTAGDTSRYRLDLVRSKDDHTPPPTFDPLLSGIDFSFKIDCPSDHDCRESHICPQPAAPQPHLDYLARDYTTFRRLIFDRLAMLSPEWTDRTPADLGVALVELFAYLGDRLTYAQDAVATEAYLGTARLRKSVRRHARLVDYPMHDGCNARTWVQVQVTDDVALAPSEVRFLTRVPGLRKRIAPNTAAAAAAGASDAQWFEPVVAHLDDSQPPPELEFYAEHNEIPLYDWGLPDFSVPAGATKATLKGHLTWLEAGTVLVLAQTVSPDTGQQVDADPTRRHPVRLTAVRNDLDGDNLTDPVSGEAITEITWAAEDALPFGLCVTSAAEPAVLDGAAAWGNIVLADHGRTVGAEALGVAGADWLAPTLAYRPLTHVPTVEVTAGPLGRVRLPYDPGDGRPARDWIATDVASSRPALRLTSTLNSDTVRWSAVPDLLDSRADDTHVVPEVDSDGSCQLRFGVYDHGRTPRDGETFTATYRYGNGGAGNIGADAVAHVITDDDRVAAVRNPLPASGGADPETIAQVRRRAPAALGIQQRAVTPADYEEVALRSPQVQRATASVRWTGSWYTTFVTVDPAATTVLDERFEQQIVEGLEPYRLAGGDLEVARPQFVPLELELQVCVGAEYFRPDVAARLKALLSATDNPDGSRGHFHPDKLSFGEPVYLSPILAAARSVAGVDSVRATVFQRLGAPSKQPLADGRLVIGRLEIARLDNDPNFSEYGTLRLVLHGGK